MRASSLIFLLQTILLMCSGCTTAHRINVELKGGLIFLPLDMEVELALSAGPEHIRSEATVYIFDKSGYRRVRNGTNGINCLVNRDGHQNGDRTLRPTCWDAEGSATIVPVMLRVGELVAQGVDSAEIEKDIELGFEGGRFISPRKTGIAYMLSGDVTFDKVTQKISQTVFPPHYMIYAPGVSNADIGITEAALESNASLPFVYDGYSGGSRTGYIIVMVDGGRKHAHH